MDEKLVSLAEVGRRVGLSAQRVRQLAATDPTFPARQKVGQGWAVVWSEAEHYFAGRHPKPGPKPRQQPAAHEAAEPVGEQ
jgi:hypothetical protein